MKPQIILPAIMLLAGCGGESGNSGEAGSTGPDASTSSSTAAPSASDDTSNAKLPFDMPIMPGARYISGSPEFSRPTKRRGGEAGATIAVKGSPLDIVNYYEKALTDNGFTPELGMHNDESIATVEGVRANGEKFSVTSMRGGSKAKAGESQTALIATKPKEP